MQKIFKRLFRMAMLAFRVRWIQAGLACVVDGWALRWCVSATLPEQDAASRLWMSLLMAFRDVIAVLTLQWHFLLGPAQIGLTLSWFGLAAAAGWVFDAIARRFVAIGRFSLGQFSLLLAVVVFSFLLLLAKSLMIQIEWWRPSGPSNCASSMEGWIVLSCVSILVSAVGSWFLVRSKSGLRDKEK